MKRRDGRGDGLATAVAASATIFILAGGVRPGGRPVALVVASAMQALAVAAACCAFAVGRAGKPRSRRALVAVIVLAPIVLLAGKLLLGAAWGGAGLTSYPIGFRCLGLSIAVGAAPLAALLRMWPGRSALHGAALGVAVGAAAWSFADAWCPVNEPQHLAVGHLLPVALLVAAGAVSLRRRPTPSLAAARARRSAPAAPPPATPCPPR